MIGEPRHTPHSTGYNSWWCFIIHEREREKKNRKDNQWSFLFGCCLTSTVSYRRPIFVSCHPYCFFLKSLLEFWFEIGMALLQESFTRQRVHTHKHGACHVGWVPVWGRFATSSSLSPLDSGASSPPSSLAAGRVSAGCLLRPEAKHGPCRCVPSSAADNSPRRRPSIRLRHDLLVSFFF